MKNEILYYTYLDECKRNYLTTMMKRNGYEGFEEYSITSITFEKKYYQNKFEPQWNELRKRYKIEGNKAMHFTEYLKLIDPKKRENIDLGQDYEIFMKDGEFSIERLKDFFKDIKKILEDAEFFLVHNDFYWERERYYTKGNRHLKKASRIIAPSILNKVPYLSMRKQLDMLMQCLLQEKNEDDKSYIFDENIPSLINTKLRFDADGKQFDARSDLKRAYNHTITVGSDIVKSETAVEILDEIRFIRKEEVGHDYMPNHCGLEVVDFLCSMIAGEMRLEEYINKGIINKASPEMKKGNFINLNFFDGEKIKFDFILDKIRYSSNVKLFNYDV